MTVTLSFPLPRSFVYLPRALLETSLLTALLDVLAETAAGALLSVSSKGL